MKSFNFFLLIIIVFIGSSFSTLHKYYISNTQIEYVKDVKSVQIITRIFIDDLENVLKERYDESLTFDNENATAIDDYLEKYLGEKLNIKIDDKTVKLRFLGKEIDMGIVKCYLEIENIKHISKIEITNEILFDLFEEQQNIIKLNINSKKKSYVLTKQKDNAVLNFN
ncbi:DUF6702 family protein [Hyunsoonleella sp. 2307UL5-6]|uniref:DUF6702 family protein n=1 Tax=Hyunsoonleella sp. 2307UL5-6 TaxID=3384768 RepID=UPI0039BD6750